MARCPSDEALVRLLDEQLDTSDQDGIVAHVEACPDCRERLEELTRGRSLQVGGRPLGEVAADPAATTAGPWLADPSATTDPVPADPNATIAPCGPNPQPAAQADGPALADYEILARLGTGGMGVERRAAAGPARLRRGDPARPGQRRCLRRPRQRPGPPGPAPRGRRQRSGGPPPRRAECADVLQRRADACPGRDRGADRRGPARALGRAGRGGYLDCAQALLGQAVEMLPAGERAAFWRDVVQVDPALLPLRHRPKFTVLAMKFAQSSR